MTFKVGDLATIVKNDSLDGVRAHLIPYIGQVIEIIGLYTRTSKKRGLYHWVKASDGYVFHVAISWLRKIEPPREDLKLVDWETVPWQPPVTA